MAVQTVLTRLVGVRSSHPQPIRLILIKGEIMSKKNKDPLYLVVVRTVVKTVANRLAADAVDLIFSKLKREKDKTEEENKK